MTLLTRSLATALFPALNWPVTGAERALYRLSPLRGPLSVLEASIRGPVLPYRQPFFPAGPLFGGLFFGILALNLVAPRFWCRILCPLGATLGLVSRVAWLRRQVIGTAYIDRSRCIPWTDNRNCIVCEEMCPVPEKAIVLDEVEAVAGDSEQVLVKRPRVIRERCIGCGLCENKCPLDSEAAIRVRPDNPTIGWLG